MNGQLSKQVIIKGTFFTKDLMIKNKVNFKSLIIEDLKIKKKTNLNQRFHKILLEHL